VVPQKKQEPGDLIVVGAHEENAGILKLVAGRAGSGTLLVAALSSEMGQDYGKLFHKLGVKKIEHLDLETRAEADDARAALIEHAAIVFFTGGDPLRVTSSFGGSRLCDLMRERHANGLPIAGASVLSGTMLVDGPNEDSHRVGDALRMAPGLAFLPEFVIDRSFARRGRVGRLLGAVAQNPRLIGIGIDENTALIVRPGEGFEVAGEGAVYVVNGQCITYTNLSESQTDQSISVHGARLDVLSRGDRFDIRKRVAIHP
jgi:cyanophycinase